jgi:hypothetical protein
LKQQQVELAAAQQEELQKSKFLAKQAEEATKKEKEARIASEKA